MSRGIYHSNWKELAARIRDRDNHECRICGSHGYECRLHVHHIDGDSTNNRQANLVSLCKECHSSVHDEGYTPYNQDDVTRPTPWGVNEPICEEEWGLLLAKSPARRIGGKAFTYVKQAPKDVPNERFNPIAVPDIPGSMTLYSDYIHKNGYMPYSQWMDEVAWFG